jgi:hypothetical protein
MALKKPIKIGKYEVVGLLGKGGMGVVYKANDPLLGRAVAIKMMTTLDYVDNPDLLQRFYREAQSTGSLHHRNIVTVYELGDHEGSPYLVMEYLEGETLDAIILSNRTVPLLDQINYILEVCDGLTYAHERSVVHRDIKPGNIMVVKDSGVKIVDFGIAHIGNRTVTRTGQLLGSLPYMSPEQISGKVVDPRTDIFSLGVVFYQLLTSHLPFEGETPAATLLKIMHDRPRPVAEYDDSFPSELDEILLRALAKDREERYASAQDLAFDLAQIRGRIQHDMVEERLSEAELLLAREELVQAREKLAEVLKIDRHNTRAMELSRAAQQRIQQREVGQQIQQLRSKAEEAYQKEQFSLALDFIQKAISLRSTDPDLQLLRSSVQEAKTRSEKLQNAVSRAESAYEQGELDSAKQAIEEALTLAPDDVHAKSLYRMIERDWAQRAQRLQVLGLIEEARKEIASRNFTLAIEVLHKAEAIDPATPELRTLIDAAQAAREQERRRKALESIKREIETDLDKDDFQLALMRAETALQEFPEDRGLQKLKELAQKQHILAERKSFVKDRVSLARKLLESGRADQSLEVLETAREKIGADPQVDSLIVVVRETLERQRTEAKKLEYLRRAKDFLRLKQYSDATETLRTAQAELGNNLEIDDLLQFALEQESAEKQRQISEAAAAKAQELVKDQNYDGAIEVLEAALKEVPDEELRLILAQARHAAADHRKLLEDVLANSSSMIQGQRPAEALRYLQSQPASFSRDPRFAELRRKANEQAERLRQIEGFLEKARGYFAGEEFDAARSILQECVRTYGRTPDLNKLLGEIDERQGQIAAEALEKALAESRTLISEGKPDQAIARLWAVETIAGKVSPKLNADYHALQQAAGAAQARKYRADIEQLIAQGSHTEAGAILQRAQSEFPQNRDLQQAAKTLEQAAQRRTDAEVLLHGADELFKKQSWREGADTCMRVAPLSARDPMVRSKALSALESAASAAAPSEWRHAEYLLQCMAQLQPGVQASEAIKQKIGRAQREESIREILDDARRQGERGEFDRALEAVGRGLKQFPSEVRFAELQQNLQRQRNEKDELARLERERKEQEAQVADIQRRLQSEPSADGRVKLLEDALRQHPGVGPLQKSLAQAREVERRVSALTIDAAKWEESRNYDQAIRCWTEIGELGVTRPDSEAAIGRLRRLQEEARTAAKAAWLRGIRDALQSFDLNLASSLLLEAQREFKDDPKVVEAAVLRDKLLKQRQENLASIAQAQSELKARRWQSASELIARSLEGADGDPTISKAAFDASLQGVRGALNGDLPAAEMFLEQAARIKNDAPELLNLRADLDRQRHEETVKRRLSDIRSIAQSDPEKALAEVSEAAAESPNDSRYLALKQELERGIEKERRAQQERKRLLEMLDAAQTLRSDGNLSGALQKIDEGLQAFPNHTQFVEMRRAVEAAIRDLEKQRRREAKERAALEAKTQREEKKRRQLEQKERRRFEPPTRIVPAPENVVEPPTRGRARMYGAIVAAIGLIAVPLAWKLSHHQARQPSPPSTAAIQIHTDPEGATIRSQETGTSCVSPNCSLNLTSGEHAVQIELPGYQSVTKYISVDQAHPNPVFVTLIPVPRADPGNNTDRTGQPQVAHLELREAPVGAEVLVDAKRVGRVGSQGSFSADVPSGSHGIQLRSSLKETVAVEKDFASGSHVELRGNDFVANKQPPATDNSNREASDWQKIKNSEDIPTVDGFMKRYPTGAFASQAQTKLENLYWAKAAGSGTSAGYSQYLVRFPNGKYAQQAHSEIADFDWHAVENSTDAGALQNFVQKYPSGANHDKALVRLDDLSWQRSDQKDLSSMQSYLGTFPDGRHAGEARKKIEDLSRTASAVHANDARTPPPVDENGAVLEILNRYQKAYEAENIQEMQKIWPAMGGPQIKGLGDFFQQASNLTLQFQVSQIQISGDAATVKFTQTLKFLVGGKSSKNSAKIVMQLNRVQGGPWQINSIR